MDTLARALVADFRAEVPATRAVVEALPEDRFGWTPHPRSMTAGRLAGHVAEAPRFVEATLADEMDFAAASGWRPFEPASRDELLRELARGQELLPRLLEDRDDAFLSATWTLRSGPTVLMRKPRHEAIREIAVHHLVHHRGQLTVYLRLLEVPVPSTYGPTADAGGSDAAP